MASARGPLRDPASTDRLRQQRGAQEQGDHQQRRPPLTGRRPAGCSRRDEQGPALGRHHREHHAHRERSRRARSRLRLTGAAHGGRPAV